MNPNQRTAQKVVLELQKLADQSDKETAGRGAKGHPKGAKPQARNVWNYMVVTQI